MTRVVSTKLSNPEHEALLEMANVRGQSISEFVRDCVMVSLCGSWKTSFPDEDLKKVEDLIEKNYQRFGASGQ